MRTRRRRLRTPVYSGRKRLTTELTKCLSSKSKPRQTPGTSKSLRQPNFPFARYAAFVLFLSDYLFLSKGGAFAPGGPRNNAGIILIVLVKSRLIGMRGEFCGL